MNQGKGYWSGMPSHLKGRAIGWAIYFSIAAALFTQNAFLGMALAALPFVWALLFVFIFEYLDFGDGSRPTLLSYTISYLWHASALSRSALCVVGTIVIGGTIWLAYGDILMPEPDKPKITQRVGEAADGWIETAKSWISRD